MTLWQVYRSLPITALEVTGFKLCESADCGTEIKPRLGRFSAGPKLMGAGLALAPVGDSASPAVFSSTGACECATQAHFFFHSWYFNPLGNSGVKSVSSSDTSFSA